VSAVERAHGLRHAHATQREFGAGEFGPRCERRRQGESGDVKSGQSFLGSLKLADEKLVSRPDQPGVERIAAVTERLERFRGRVERVRWSCQITRGERYLSLGNLAAGLGEAFASAEAVRGAEQELARPLVVAELGHRNAAERQRWRVVAQCDALKRTERITGGEQARGRGDE